MRRFFESPEGQKQLEEWKKAKGDEIEQHKKE